MSSLLWPTFPGQTLNVHRAPRWDVDVQSARSGKEQRLSRWSIPRYRYEFELNFLRLANTVQVKNTSGAVVFTGTEPQALEWFFAQVQGRWDTFLLNDPMMVQPAYYLVGGSPIGPPALSSSSLASGTLPTGTYAHMVTSVSPSGGESIQQAEVTFGITGPAGVQVNWTPVAGAAGYNVYGRQSGLEQLLAFVAGQASSSYIDNGSITPCGPLPQQRVRFDMDDLEFEQIYSRLWGNKSIKMISVK